jgi:hypothetical protein
VADDGAVRSGEAYGLISNAVFTPCGLHVRLPTHVAFGLMAQLRPKVRPSEVLATTEVIEFTPTALGKLLALVGFVLDLSPVTIALLAIVGRVLPNLLAIAGVAIAPGLTVIGRLYRPLAGYGLTLVAVAFVGLLLTGPVAALGFLVGMLVGGVVNMLVDFLLMRRVATPMKQPLSSTERFFFHALRQHARATGQPLDLERPPTAAEDGPWREALADYAAEHPRRARQSYAGDDREPPR